MPLLLPHRATGTILVTYPDKSTADEIERSMRTSLDRKGPRWELELISDRPPMKDRKVNQRLANRLRDVAAAWDITLGTESSVWPSVAGLVPAKTACVCGIGPVARNLGTPHESVERISLVERTLLLAEFLAQFLDGNR